MKSETIGKLAAALSKVQANLKGAVKDSSNPFYKSKYADLESVWEACREQLAINELSVAQPMAIVDGRNAIETVLMHSSGEWISGVQLLSEVKPDPQATGSAITYARRYALAAMIGIIQTDDDAESAMNRRPVAQSAPVTTQATAGNLDEKANEAAYKFSSSKTLKEAMDNWSKYVAPIYQSLDKDKQAAFERAKEKLKGELK